MEPPVICFIRPGRPCPQPAFSAFTERLPPGGLPQKRPNKPVTGSGCFQPPGGQVTGSFAAQRPRLGPSSCYGRSWQGGVRGARLLSSTQGTVALGFLSPRDRLGWGRVSPGLGGTGWRHAGSWEQLGSRD